MSKGDSCQCANNDVTDDTPHSPQLASLLSKLRPFQREAFDFAVHGASCQNGNQTGASGKRYALPSDDGSVAGAGTGRILLGDEMGLG
jgi:hypothetical protein